MSMFVGEIVTYFAPNENLFYYSILSVFDVMLFIAIIYEELKAKLVLVISIPLVAIFYFIILTTDFSFIMAMGFEDKYPLVQPIGVHQFFDFTSILALIRIVLSFAWLSYIVNNTELKGKELVRKYIYIFAFLVFFGGSFFVVAFARLASPDTMKWVEFWDVLYLPIYILYFLTLVFNLLWKSTTSS